MCDIIVLALRGERGAIRMTYAAIKIFALGLAFVL